MNRLPLCLLFLTMVFVVGPAANAQPQDNSNPGPVQLKASELGEYDPVRTPNLENVENRIVEQTNQFRQEQGREKVEVDRTLQKAAEQFAKYMAETDKYGHQADGRSPSERATAQGYNFCLVSENIAYQFQGKGFETKPLAQGFFKMWKNSPGHRKNMLQPDVTETAVAVAQSQTTGVFYAVQMFGRPQSAQIEFRLINRMESPLEYQIAGQPFSLPSGYSRRHILCRPSKLRWQPRPDSDQSTREIQPSDGEELQVQTEAGKIIIEPMDSAGSETSP